MFFCIAQGLFPNREGICLNTTQLECFLAVANHLNFSRAARQLDLTQPAVSHQIGTLEDELGANLFHRTSKSVQLTQAGYLFLQYASEIMKLAGISKARIREADAARPPRLGIGCRNFLELNFLGGLLERMREELPQLIPILRMSPFASLKNLLEEGAIQVMLTLREPFPAKVTYRELARCPVVCLCGRDNPLAGYERLTLEQLRRGGRLAVCPPQVYPPALFSAQSQAVAGRGADELLLCDNLEAAATLVRAGFAVAVAADLPNLRAPDLRYIPIDGFAPLSYGVAYPAGRRDPVLRRFLEVLSAALARPEGDPLP